MAKEEKLASRVTLVDAVNLDLETYRILKDQLSKATKFLSASFLVKWEAELDALLRYGIWKLSVCKHHATFGQQLLGVKYGSSFTYRKAQLLIILTVGCAYLKQKISLSSSSDDNSRFNLQRVKKLLSVVESITLVASLINLIVFLRNGYYPTLIDRILQLHPISAVSPGNSRVVGYQYMTRELLWHGFIELITFTVPLINYQSFKKYLTNWFRSKNAAAQITLRRREPYLAGTKCIVCNEVPVLPHHIGCAHTFCYYCVQTSKAVDGKMECISCGHRGSEATSLALNTTARSIRVG